MRKQIPNIITLCNLTCGVIATVYAASGLLLPAALFILLGIFFDFFDGLAARLLHVESKMGAELDSLADVITSGVAPAIILCGILGTAEGLPWLRYVALLTPALAAYRLARFNLDERQHHGQFLGLPVPANGLIWVGLAIISSTGEARLSTPLLIAAAIISLLTAILMVTDLPMFSLKFNFKDLSWRSNWVRYLFLVGCLVLIIVLPRYSLSLIILWYILLSICTQRKEASHE